MRGGQLALRGGRSRRSGIEDCLRLGFLGIGQAQVASQKLDPVHTRPRRAVLSENGRCRRQSEGGEHSRDSRDKLTSNLLHSLLSDLLLQ